MKLQQCEYCGCKHTEGNPVTFGPDPFNLDQYGDDTNHWMCEVCIDQQTADC